MITDLSTIIDFRKMVSISDKASPHVTPKGQSVFLKPVKFFVHLLSFGPEDSMTILNEIISYRDAEGSTTGKMNGLRKHPTDDVFFFDMNWDPNEPELGIESTEKTKHTLVRLSMHLPSTRIRSEKLLELTEGVQTIGRTRYNVSPRTLAFFLEFGLVRNLKPVAEPECFNPYRQIPLTKAVR